VYIGVDVTLLQIIETSAMLQQWLGILRPKDDKARIVICHIASLSIEGITPYGVTLLQTL
jgi:hypothetical protein